ncbi:MAG: FAD-binding oxidoreductase [Alphaproteobacteria bacterium]|nr:FAD-binding oxidoreductase [Alphaproteobacteria bacterium]MBU0797895.1 FAD-binding oxidoreductase [Alphaproteobacteria bacterium]MBU0886153.1 FAD-binding oxidoreductase [Alphaproteobacteria bacterium]MBU1812793.1 FAD-binding oxidoreductase [Alphaproteobacteria bacterium]MBU2089935.1 FAD-binding oxidoreductase [Alphaproteobacteria bacterium]
MTETCDFLVIGAGIAGASAGYELARHGTVIVAEKESQPGYHTTGRSAALFAEGYGNAAIRALTRASRAFFETPPEGFSEAPLLAPRGALMVAQAAQMDRLDAAFAETQATLPGIIRLDAAGVMQHAPVMREGYAAGGFLNPGERDMDVHAIHQGFLRGIRAQGGKVITEAGITGLTRQGEGWLVETTAGSFSAGAVVNASGAWADEIADLAGAKRIGLVPKRRTAFTFDPPAGMDVHDLPAVVDIDEDWYFRPESGRLMGSPADEIPSPPCDAQPEEMDIAIAVDRIEQATIFQIRRLASRWAGLRSFVADKTMVAGFAPEAPGFFWLAGQGGYGIQTAPAMGRVAAGLIVDKAIPADIAGFGISAADLSPTRSGLFPKG